MATPECQKKIDGFFARVDEKLAGPDSTESKIALLKRLSREWTEDFGDFTYIVQSGREIPKKWEGADAIDFRLTIMGIDQRLVRLQQMEVA